MTTAIFETASCHCEGEARSNISIKLWLWK